MASRELKCSLLQHGSVLIFSRWTRVVMFVVQFTICLSCYWWPKLLLHAQSCLKNCIDMDILLYWTMLYGLEYWKTWYGILGNLITLQKVPDDQIISGYFRASVLSETQGQTMNRIRGQAVTLFRRNCRSRMRNIIMPTPVLLEWFDFCTLFAVIHVVTGPFIYVYD